MMPSPPFSLPQCHHSLLLLPSAANAWLFCRRRIDTSLGQDDPDISDTAITPEGDKHAEPPGSSDADLWLSKAHVLVCGMNGTAIEFCKNIVLAGVGRLSLMDDHIVMEDDLNASVLIPPDEGMYGGRS